MQCKAVNTFQSRWRYDDYKEGSFFEIENFLPVSRPDSIRIFHVRIS